MTNTKPAYKVAVEFSFYVAFAVAMAFGTSFLLRPPVPASRQQTIARSKYDALRLQTTLRLATGTPTIVEFMDFECPPCRASYPRLKAILKAHPGTLYRAVNFPLNIHPFAFGAAVASEIATAQGEHDRVFEDMFTGRTDLDPKSLNDYLQAHDMPAIVGKRESAPFKRAVQSEIELAKEMNVNGTPTILVLARDGSLTEVRGFDLIPDLLK